MTETRDTRTTERNESDQRASTDAPTLEDVSHTHPDTGRSFGGNFTFARAGAVVADGGRPDVVPEDDDEERETLKDVEHTPPNESEDANRVFERGEEAHEADAGDGDPSPGDGSEDEGNVGEDEGDVGEDE